MEYRRFQQTIVARMDKGEEILTKLQEICEKEQIKLASVSALGAVGEFTVGLFDTVKKQYQSASMTGDFEIVSLTGTVNTMGGGILCPHSHERRGQGIPCVWRSSEPGCGQRHMRDGHPDH